MRENIVQRLRAQYAEHKAGQRFNSALLVHEAADEIERLTAALSTARAQGEAEGWQPIETAPMDQTTVLVFVPTARYSKVLCGNCGLNASREPTWVIDGRFSFDIGGVPTHWRLLPAPPASEPKP